jgi:hypothetical protein
MSKAYDAAVGVIDSEVHEKCDYDAYLNLRDAVDALERDKAVAEYLVYKLSSVLYDLRERGEVGARGHDDKMTELGIEAGPC